MKSNNIILGQLLLLLLASCLSILSVPAQAQHKGISFQAVLKDPDGNSPTGSGLTVTLQILDPVNNCVLREEDHIGVSITSGYMNLVIGDSAATTPAATNPNPILSIKQVMDNSKVINGFGCTYTPTVNDARKLRVKVNVPRSGGGTDLVIADFNMRAAAFAVNSEMLNGKSDTDLVNVNSAQGVTQANVESIFNRFTKLDAILNNFNAGGTSIGANITGNAATATTAVNVSGTVAIANGGTGATTAATARTNLGLGSLATMSPTGTADNTTYLRGDGTWATVSGGGGAVSSVAGRTGAVTLSNTDISGLGTAATQNVGTSANNIVQLDGSSKLPAVDGSALTNITTTIDKVVNAAAKYFDYRPNNVACNNGEILKYSTGTGWVCANAATTAGAVTSVTAAGTAGNPIAIGGTASAPTVDLPVATSGQNGYLKSADWTTFNSKQTGSTELNAVAGLALTGILQRTGSGTYTALGTSAPLSVVAGNITLGTVPVANGGTGSTDGSITGTGALTFTAGGSNQSITLSPSGTGSTVLNGNVGIGTTSPVSSLQVAGSFSTNLVAKSTSYTLTGLDSVVASNASGGAMTITLPTAVGITGRQYTIKKVDSSTNAVTVATTGGQTIDGATTSNLSAQYQFITVVSDGANWFIISNVQSAAAACVPGSATFSVPVSTTWAVPAGCTSFTVKMWGGGGGFGSSTYANAFGGGGGFATATFSSIASGQVFDLLVGGGGVGSGSGGAGGLNGGGAGGYNNSYNGGGGGGRSALVYSGADLITAAGGGGGGEGLGGGPGGSGGAAGNSGVDGTTGNGGTRGLGGGAGTLVSGGAGGTGAGNGGAGTLGSGGAGAVGVSSGGGGGGGGGGYYGGGGGGSSSINSGASGSGGGGGGSNYVGGGGYSVTSNYAFNGSGTTPGNSADSARGTAGNGGTATTQNGGDGLVIISWP